MAKRTVANKVKKFEVANSNVAPKKMVERETIFGNKFMEEEDAPYLTSPRSETYWCS